jgi:hypothetical protein
VLSRLTFGWALRACLGFLPNAPQAMLGMNIITVVTVLLIAPAFLASDYLRP